MGFSYTPLVQSVTPRGATIKTSLAMIIPIFNLGFNMKQVLRAYI